MSVHDVNPADQQAGSQGIQPQEHAPEHTAQASSNSATGTGNEGNVTPSDQQAGSQDVQPQENAPEPTAQDSSSPATGTGNGEGNTSPPTGTASSAGNAKKRVSRKDKLLKFEALSEQGKSREEIMKEMDISLGEFGLLFFYFSQSAADGIKIDFTDPVRKPKISGEGGFSVSMWNIQRLKADDVFIEGKKVDLRYNKETKEIIASIYEGEDSDETSDEADE